MKVSVIVPLYNEEKHVENLILSLAKQTFPMSDMEWLFVDGCSTDKTMEIVQKYCHQYPIKVLVNEKRKTPYALNLAIEHSIGDYIIRLDAHASYYPDYIEKCVYYLDTTDADNVGGVAITESKGFIGGAIAQMMSSRFGVGSSDFRTGQGNKYVDTVPFGAFRREVFNRLGLFNTKLLRSEDNDMNARIRDAGGKIWLAEDIKFKYYCRDTIKGILKMAIQNGNALWFTLKENKSAMSMRHFIPFLFLLSIIALPLIGVAFPIANEVFLVEMCLYFLLDIVFSFFNKKPKYGVITIWLYPLFHLVYGFGSLISFFGIKTY